MADKYKIKCPNCGKTGWINSENFQKFKESNSILLCSTCDVKERFEKWGCMAVNANQEPSITVVNNSTDISENKQIGMLKVEGYEKCYQLSLGENVIGRKFAGSKANIQIDCNHEKMRFMSRMHSMIVVKQSREHGYTHYLSNANNLNKTYINDELIVGDDILILKKNDIIKMGGVAVRFVVDGESVTEYGEF